MRSQFFRERFHVYIISGFENPFHINLCNRRLGNHFPVEGNDLENH